MWSTNKTNTILITYLFCKSVNVDGGGESLYSLFDIIHIIDKFRKLKSTPEKDMATHYKNDEEQRKIDISIYNP